MKSTVATLFALSLVVPAFAQDGDPKKPPAAPTPVAPAPAPKPDGGDAAKPAAAAPAGKKERKTTPEAEAAIKRYADLLSFPPPDAKSFHFLAEFEMAMFGGAVKLDYRWEKDKTPTVKVDLPEALLAQIPEQAHEQMKKQMGEQIGGQLTERFDTKLAKYNLSHKAEGGGLVVEITPNDDKCEYETGKLVFDANGLLTKQTVTPHVDPSNPQAAMMAGVEIETTFTHVKKGDHWTIESMTATSPMGDTAMKFAYYEVAGISPLPKSIEISNPMMPEPITVAYHDWEVDGKAVAGTEAKKADAAKPADKPADKPAAKPDAPAKDPKDAPK